MPRGFLLRNYNYSYTDIYIHRGYVLQIVEIILSHSILHQRHTSREHAVFQAVVVVRKTAFTESILQGVQNDGRRRLLSWYCKEGEYLIRLLVGRSLRCRCLNYLNVCTYRCEVIVSPLLKNYTNKIPSLSQKPLAMTSPAQVCTSDLFSLLCLSFIRYPCCT